jgi:adenylate kinase family enzyme
MGNDEKLKIAICGRMASGKTTLANEIVKNYGEGEVLSLATEVKNVARRVFGMVEKDRPLLQQIGMKMRDIEQDVWLNFLLRQADDSDAPIVVVDDVRFVNEVDKMRNDGFVTIKIVIDEERQLERLKKTYPNDWEIHWENRNNPSEMEVDLVPDWWFDFTVSAQEIETGWDFPRLFQKRD